MKKVLSFFAAVVLLCTAAAASDWRESPEAQEASEIFSRCDEEQLFVLFDLWVEETSSRQYPEDGNYVFVANKSSKKFHTMGCKYVRTIAPENRLIERRGRDYLVVECNYKPCGECNP